jgi:hypothetical protein
MNNERNNTWLIIYVAFTVSLLLLVKVFFFDQCFAFDSNDDANHTFVNLKAARDLIINGSMPNLNLFNNFGTPLLGDALTFPFAIHSITYWFMPDYQAMTVNRAVISFATIVMLSLLLRRFMSLRATLLCALMVFFSPGQLWNMAHHHYQMALLCLCSILYIQICHDSISRKLYLSLLWGGYVILQLSVSIQLVLLSLPFLILFLPLFYGLRAKEAWLLNIAALASAVTATYPHTAVFFKNIEGSTRSHWSPYSGIFSTTREQLLALLVPPGEWMQYGVNGHFSIVTYYSIAYLGFVLIAIMAMATRRTSTNDPLLRLIMILGVIPAVSGYILQFHGQSIPYLRNVDSTRIWWFSNVFLVLAVGKLIDSQWSRFFNWLANALICAVALSILATLMSLDRLIPEFEGLSLLHKLVMWGTCAGMLAILLASFERYNYRASKVVLKVQENHHPEGFIQQIGKYLIFAVLMLAQLPTLVHVLGLNSPSCEKGNHFFNLADEATFQPLSLLGHMKKGYRLASVEPPVNGHDLKAIHGGVLGSNARAIVADQQLMEMFTKSKLIVLDDTYFFSPPWQTEKLNQLGIRYLLINREDAELQLKGWRVVATDQYKGQPYYLYENPSGASLVYLQGDTGQEFLHNYELASNGIKILLPELIRDSNLIISFFYRKSWQSWTDGRENEPTMNALGMMQVEVKPGDKVVVFHYLGLSSKDFLLSFLYSFVILGSSLFVLSSCKKIHDQT